MNDDTNNIEFSREFNLSLTKKTGSEILLEATGEECEALAARFSIPKVVFLKAKCFVTKLKQKETGDYKLVVNMSAEIIQQCVMTLSEVPETINENFSIVFVLEESGQPADDIKIVDFDMNEEDIEIITDTKVDLGELIAEYLSLSMNPYPRKQSTTGDELGYKILNEDETDTSEEKKNPFNVLESLKH